MVDTHTSNPTGNVGYWSDANSWTSTGGGIPTAGDSVVIAANHTIYYDVAIANQVSLAALTVTGTLRFCTASTPAGNLNSVAPASRTGLGLLMADGISITGAGALYAGNSTTDYIARPSAAAAYAPNVTITLGTTGQINVVTQRYYGWIPTAPAANPAFTTIVGSDTGDDTPPLATETKIRVADSGFDLLNGEQILVGVGGTPGVMVEANKGLYTVSGIASSVITISTAGGLVTNRVLGDYVSVYSRPILITKAAFNSGSNSVTPGIMQGTRVNNMRFTSGTGWQFTGCTVECGNNSLASLAQGGIKTKFIDCVSNYANNGGLTYNDFNNYFSGCAGFNSAFGGLSTGSSGNIYLNCIVQNNAYGLASGQNNTTNANKFINCHALANSLGCLAAYGSNTFINCTSALGSGTWGDLAYPKDKTRLYSCTLSTTPMVGNYTSTYRAPWETAQSYDHAGVAGARRFWGRGGNGATGAYGSPYNAYVNPMKFIVEIQNTSTVSGVMIWDTEFMMPANKSLTINVPMARDTLNIAAELWIVNPFNDPLWFDPSWQVSPTESTACTTMGSAATTYVVKHAAISAATGTWQSVAVTIPAYTYARPLIARVIMANSTAAAGNGYADIDTLEKMLLKKRVVFL